MVYLRHLLPISALGGLVHVLAALAVVALPVRRPTSSVNQGTCHV